MTSRTFGAPSGARIGATWSQSGSDPSSVSLTTPLNGGRRIGSVLRSIDSLLTRSTSVVLRPSGRRRAVPAPCRDPLRDSPQIRRRALHAAGRRRGRAQRRRATRRDVRRATLRVASIGGLLSSLVAGSGGLVRGLEGVELACLLGGHESDPHEVERADEAVADAVAAGAGDRVAQSHGP